MKDNTSAVDPFRQKNKLIRIVEKLPGINLGQYIWVGSKRYMLFPKCGTRSIRRAYMAKHGIETSADWLPHIHYFRPSAFASELNTDTTVLFTRDPFERLKSCWSQKISSQRDNAPFYFWQYWPRLYPEMPFELFLKRIAKLPPWAFEKHFISFSYWCALSVDELRIELVTLDALDSFLAQEFGGTAPQRANTTVGPSEQSLKEARDIYDTHLRAVFSFDEELFRRSKPAVRP